MIRAVGFISMLALLSACQGGVAQTATASAEDIARGQAKTVVTTVVQQKLPGVDVAFATDCIIDNATLPEIFSIAKASVTGPDEVTARTVIDIAQRPETAQCIFKNSPLALL